MKDLTASPTSVRRLALTTVVAYALLVLSGGAVRLTGSGLGCPDWPSCYHTRLVAALSFHPMVEDVNRFFTGAVSVLSIVAFLAVWRRSPRRGDLFYPAGGLLVGLLAQIVLGGIVVLTKLNPYLVCLHFLLTLVVLAVAIVLFHRAGVPDEFAGEPPVANVGRDLHWLTRVLLLVLAVVSLAGTVVTGSGPHAGAPGTRRIPIAFRDAAELHSSLAWMLLGLSVASLFAFHLAKAPQTVQRRMRMFFELVMVQGALGYTQYFLHDAAGVVELHLAGVTALWIAAIFLYLSLDSRPALLLPSTISPVGYKQAWLDEPAATPEPVGPALSGVEPRSTASRAPSPAGPG